MNNEITLDALNNPQHTAIIGKTQQNIVLSLLNTVKFLIFRHWYYNIMK